MSTGKVVTVIPNWNLKEDLGACIRSLLESEWVDHEIVVVDDASTNGAAEWVCQGFPQVTLFALPENGGYARALNTGIRYALERGAEFVFALNNDTVIPPGTLPALVAQMRRPEIGILTPKIAHFSHPDILYSLGSRRYRFLPIPIEFGRLKRDSARYTGLMEYDYVTGCAMLIRADLFGRIGLFEEGYFMYYEDNDFCRRARDAGYRIACDGGVKILHKVSISSKIRGAKIVFYQARNKVLFYRRFPHGPARWLTALALWIMAVVYSAAHVVRGQPGWLKPYWTGFLQGWRLPLARQGGEPPR